MRVFSFDPAEINLGFVCLEYHSNAAQIIRQAREALATARQAFSTGQAQASDIIATLQNMRQAIVSCVVLHAAEHVNIAQHNDSDEHVQAQRGQASVARAVALKRAVHRLIEQHGRPDLVVVEYQMPLNGATVSISHQLMYEFCDVAHVVHVDPAMKATVDLNSAAQYRIVQSKYMNNYTGNKAHSRANLDYFLAVWSIADAVRKKIPKNASRADIADALMQCIAWLRSIGDARRMVEHY
jgi:hypothetical protein